MKNTRQALAALLFALLAAIFFAGCSDGSESSSSIVGTWKDENSRTYVFNLGGTFTTTDGEDTTTGNWSLSGSTLTLTVSESGNSQTMVMVYLVAFSGDTMTLTPISVTMTEDGQTTNIPADQMPAETWTRVS